MQKEIAQTLLDLGARNVGQLQVSEIVFNPEFRKACETNACGLYNRCWMCPPHAGDIHDLIARGQQYTTAVVYQTIYDIEDSYDIEGMLEGGKEHNKIAQKLNTKLTAEVDKQLYLHLGAGGCKVCDKCSKIDEIPCIHPDKAMASLETYGIDVTQLAKAAGMKYINGQNTVTYFGAVLFK